VDEATCTLLDGANGTVLRAMLPVPDDLSGQVHYRVVLGTLSGSELFTYPGNEAYHVLSVAYRASYGGTFGALVMFMLIAGTVWGGLGIALRTMMTDGEEKVDLADALLEEEVDA
jgi:hypothetical protein